jgi:VIT1/CCC1 family predicted Fe2+/Mn2+ transporter
MKKLTAKEQQVLIKNQKNEINGYIIYSKLSGYVKDKKNAKLLKMIAESEKKHYSILKKYSGVDIKPDYLKVFFYILSAKILGLTFTLKLLEKGEANADNDYKCIKKRIPQISSILKDEDKHEGELLNMINESKLNYMGSVVLGLNDALVELTGALAGFTFAIQNNKIIAMIGLITGISASLSMASSEFLSKRQEDEKENAFLASAYTGTAYIITVILLILPFFPL